MIDHHKSMKQFTKYINERKTNIKSNNNLKDLPIHEVLHAVSQSL